MEIKGPQWGQLCEALLDAFPTRPELKRMVRFKLGKNLDAITEGRNLEDTVFELVEWSIGEGRLGELVTGALEQKSQNMQLSRVVQELGLSVSSQKSEADQLVNVGQEGSDESSSVDLPRNIEMIRLRDNQHFTRGFGADKNAQNSPTYSSAIPMEAKNTINIVYCYASEDKELRDELDKQLRPLARQYSLSIWDESKIKIGREREQEIQEKLDSAHIILWLISPDFMASDYIDSREMLRAIERHRAGDAYVIAVILRPVDWRGAAFNNLIVLPKGDGPVTKWPDRDEALLAVERGVRKVIEEVRAKQAESSRVVESQLPLLSMRERILQILYEKRSDRTFDGEDLARLVEKQWREIQSDVAKLEEKGYIVIKQSQITTRIFYRPRITTKGITFFESGMLTSL